MYTFGGQPSERYFENKMTNLTCYEQRGYLEGFIPVPYLDKLETALGSDICYFIEYPNGTTKTNIPFEVSGRYTLHRESHMGLSGFTIVPEMYKFINPLNWETTMVGACLQKKRMDSLEDEIDLHVKEGVNPNVFEDIALVFLVARDFNASTSIEKNMIQFLSQ